MNCQKPAAVLYILVNSVFFILFILCDVHFLVSIPFLNVSTFCQFEFKSYKTENPSIETNSQVNLDSSRWNYYPSIPQIILNHNK